MFLNFSYINCRFYFDGMFFDSIRHTYHLRHRFDGTAGGYDYNSSWRRIAKNSYNAEGELITAVLMSMQ